MDGCDDGMGGRCGGMFQPECPDMYIPPPKMSGMGGMPDGKGGFCGGFMQAECPIGK